MSRTGYGSFDELLSALKAGHPLAFRTVYTDFGGRISAFAASRGVEDPDGLANEVLFAVFEAAPRFRGSEPNFTSFVFKIARNKIADDLRRQSRRPRSASPADLSSLREPSSSDEMQVRAEQDRVRAIVNVLPRQQRDVVLMRVVAGMSHGEIARTLGKRVGAVRAINHRAMTRLRELVMDLDI